MCGTHSIVKPAQSKIVLETGTGTPTGSWTVGVYPSLSVLNRDQAAPEEKRGPVRVSLLTIAIPAPVHVHPPPHRCEAVFIPRGRGFALDGAREIRPREGRWIEDTEFAKAGLNTPCPLSPTTHLKIYSAQRFVNSNS
jgi:hypothetical protein